jgi:hypothetical protein
LSQSKKGILEIQRTTEIRNPGVTRPEEIRNRKAEKGFYYNYYLDTCSPGNMQTKSNSEALKIAVLWT